MWVWHDACIQVQIVQPVVPAEQNSPLLLSPKVGLDELMMLSRSFRQNLSYMAGWGNTLTNKLTNKLTLDSLIVSFGFSDSFMIDHICPIRNRMLQFGFPLHLCCCY